MPNSLPGGRQTPSRNVLVSLSPSDSAVSAENGSALISKKAHRSLSHTVRPFRPTVAEPASVPTPVPAEIKLNYTREKSLPVEQPGLVRRLNALRKFVNIWSA